MDEEVVWVDYTDGCIKGYNQALEDFETKIKECCSIAGSCDYEDMERIKEQLKR